MPISTQDAAQALSDIARTQRRAAILLGYERGAPHFLWWGPIWVLGYGLSELAPEHAGLGWLVLDLVGIVGSVLIGRAAAACGPGLRAAQGLRWSASAAVVFAFVLVTYRVMAPQQAAQFGAFPALLMAAIYAVVGIWRGVRWLVAGALVGTCTLAGVELWPAHFMLWMAVVGGGTLILSGLWLRRA